MSKSDSKDSKDPPAERAPARRRTLWRPGALSDESRSGRESLRSRLWSSFVPASKLPITAEPDQEKDIKPIKPMPLGNDTILPHLADTPDNTGPETLRTKRLETINKLKLRILDARIRNGWPPILDDKTEGHKSKTGQPKTGESARQNPLDISKMVSVKKGKEWVKRWTRSKPVNVLSALPPLTSITPSPLTSITIEPFAETVQESLGESISSGEKAGVDRIDESKPGRSITSCALTTTKYPTRPDKVKQHQYLKLLEYIRESRRREARAIMDMLTRMVKIERMFSAFTLATNKRYLRTLMGPFGESSSSGKRAVIYRIDKSGSGSITSALTTKYTTWLDNRNLIINKRYLQALSGKVKPSPHNLGGVPMEAHSPLINIGNRVEYIDDEDPFSSLVPKKPPTDQSPSRLNKGKERDLSEKQSTDYTLRGVSIGTDSPGVQSSSHTPGVLGDEETSLVPKMPLPHISPIQLEEPALLEQPSFETLSGVPIETDSPQVQSSSPISRVFEDMETYVVPEKPPTKYPTRLNKDKERALSEQQSPGTLKDVLIETDSPQVLSSSPIPGMFEDMGTSVAPEKPLTQHPAPLNKVKEPTILERSSPDTLKDVLIETDSSQVQSSSRISGMFEDMETSVAPEKPFTQHPEPLNKVEEPISERCSPDTLKDISIETDSSQVQSSSRISGALEDMKTSLVSENMPSLERQDPSNSGSKSAGVVKRVPLVGSSEIYVDDEMDSSRSQPDSLFGNEIEFRPYHRNWFDVIGIWVENRIKSEIFWWPLRSPVPPQESGLTQMSWKCGCGSTISTVISNETIGRYHSPSSPAGITSGSVRTVGTSQVSGQPPTRPSAVLATTGRLSSTPQQTTSGISVISSAGNIVANLGTFVLCCVRKRQHRTVLIQMDMKTFSNDREFFRKLKAEYRRARGWKRWLSLSFVARIKFVRFIRYYQDYVDCQDSEELPPHTNSDYKYIPKPPENPPVFPVAEFMHYFERPDCAGTTSDCLALMPKRVVGPLGRGRRVEGWGLQPMEGLSMWKFISLLVIVWLGTLAFAIWWLVKHPNDFQNAFVPATYAAAFAAIAVVLPEVLKVYK